MRYTIDKGHLPYLYLVYDNVSENYVFRGTWDECRAWIDAKEATK